MPLYACLPFVELPEGEEIAMGPVHFWPSSVADEYLSSPGLASFQSYLGKVIADKRSIACVSIDEQVQENLRDALLVDALYLLYFAVSFRNVYYNAEILKIRSFTKILPATEMFLSATACWDKACIAESQREEIVCINWLDKEICQALGKALEAVYLQNGDHKMQDASIRLTRAIRFFVDRFFSKFETLFSSDLHPELFEPEDTLLLSSSFDVLLNIDEKHATADFRQKIRPMLHLKFSKPIELFWKWVDAFYLLKKQVIHGTPIPNDLFRDNPNFEVPLLHIGVKLFIYTVYYKLFKIHLIHSENGDRFTPPDFKWIHPQEVLLFFWTEESILRKISLLLMRDTTAENLSDLKLLESTYVNMMERFFHTAHPFAEFHPASKETLEPYLTPIFNHEDLSLEFLLCLKKRFA